MFALIEDRMEYTSRFYKNIELTQNKKQQNMIGN